MSHSRCLCTENTSSRLSLLSSPAFIIILYIWAILFFLSLIFILRLLWLLVPLLGILFPQFFIGDTFLHSVLRSSVTFLVTPKLNYHPSLSSLFITASNLSSTWHLLLSDICLFILAVPTKCKLSKAETLSFLSSIVSEAPITVPGL